MTAIEVSQICKTYPNKKEKIVALDAINLKVFQSEIFGLIGPDGAGKTSLMRILTSLILADSGRAVVDGLDVVNQYETLRTRIGYMPGRFSLYQDLTVEENLQFYASVFNTTIERNFYLIKDIYQQIEAFKDRRAGNLSGGMKQKLALSCALIHKPKVLFLDEPTTGVDAVSRREFWEMLKGLQKQEITIFVSTPYMDEAALCDRVALIQRGHILKVDTPLQIQNDYKGQLWSIQSDQMYKLMLDLKNWDQVYSCFAFGDSMHVSFINTFHVKEQCLQYLSDKKHSNINIEIIRPGIEDCFMQLMKSA